MSENRQDWQAGQVKQIDGVECVLTRVVFVDRKRDVARVWYATRPDGSETATVDFLLAT